MKTCEDCKKSEEQFCGYERDRPQDAAACAGFADRHGGHAAEVFARMLAEEVAALAANREDISGARGYARGAYVALVRTCPEEFREIGLVYNRWNTFACAAAAEEIARATERCTTGTCGRRKS